MIVDSSAIIAILRQEPDALQFAAKLASAGECRMSVATFVETAVVADNQKGLSGPSQLDTLLRNTQIRLEPLTVEQAHIARQAYFDYGKGHHPTGLNFGDCFAYALSKATGEPLLFKGDDFRKTDIEPAL